MAETAHKLANGLSRIDFATEPARYRHWTLAVDGAVATLTMDVDENGGLLGVLRRRQHPHAGRHQPCPQG
jgi:hypothetical protein